MNIKYRPEIDGLRAIAVGVVILYHAKIFFLGNEIFKGGFLGVDIFFVISGYLITSILDQEISSNKKISILSFYERRIRRIIPALLFVLASSTLFAWFFLLPSGLVEYSKSLISSILFGSNFYFNFIQQDYAAQDSLLVPLLHTWSLSVEEQFYIIFPILLLLILKLNKKFIFFYLFPIFIISLSFADYNSKINISETFYFTYTRIWELLAGSIVFYLEKKFKKNYENIYLYNFFPLFGLILILLSFFIFDDKMHHPSLLTLLPVLGVSIILFFSNNNLDLTTKFLSNRILVGCGLISYSLYLWHYPIFAFARITGIIQGSLLIKFLIGLLIFSLSILTFFFIEKPTRNRKNSFKFISLILLVSILILSIFNFAIIKNEGFKKRFPDFIIKNIDTKKNLNILKDKQGDVCFNKIDGCNFNINSRNKVFLIGDSHLGAISNDLVLKLISENYNVRSHILGNCLFFPGFDKFFRNAISNKCLDSHFEKLKNDVLKEKTSTVIILGRLPLYLSKRYFDNGEGGIEGKEWIHEYRSNGKYLNLESSFTRNLNEIAANGNKIILIYPIPEVGWNVPNEILKRFIFEKKDFIVDNYVTTSYDTFKKRTESSFKLLDTIQGQKILRIYPHELFCDNLISDRCISHDDDEIFYSDDDHLSEIGAKMLNNLIISSVRK